MTKLTFDNIYQHLQAKGIKCIRFPSGIKVYDVYRIGSFMAVCGKCIFRGNIPADSPSIQSHLRNLLSLFECDTIALIGETNYIEYISSIKAIKSVQE